jgi:ribosomal protein S18 acetylase RimI-like enzyme
MSGADFAARHDTAEMTMSEPTAKPNTSTVRRAAPAVAALALIFAIDWFTPADIPFGPWYLLPVALAAWSLGAWPTAAIVGIATLARTVVLAHHFAGDGFAIYSVDLAITLLAHAGTAVGVARWRRVLARLAADANAFSTQARDAQRRIAFQWSIRRAVPSDIDAILELVVAGARDGDLDKAALDPARQQVLRAAYLQGIETGSGTRHTWAGGKAVIPAEFWVSHLNGALAGYFMVVGLDDKGGSERELHAIATATAYRGMGLGSAMVDFFCAHYHGRSQFAACMPGGHMHRMLTQRGFRRVAATNEGHVIVRRPEWLRHGTQEAGAKLGFVPVDDSMLEPA